MSHKDDKAMIIESATFELDKAHVEKPESQNVTENNATVYGTVAQNIVEQRNYEIGRQRLVRLCDDAIGVSNSVTGFLNTKPQFASKLDVLAGEAEIDDSLEEPMRGKEL